jgi:hypothetical protein
MADPFGGLGLEIDDEEERRRQLQEMSGLDNADDLGGEVRAQGTGLPTPEVRTTVASPAVGAGLPVPPPPPPPPPSTFEPLTPQLGGFASEWLDNPNRYLSDMATAQRTASEQRIGQAEEAGRVANDEFYASRGLTGSSYEGEGRKRLDEALQRTRGEDEARILEMLATAETADRQAAGEFGLEAIRAGDVMGLDRYRAGLEADQLREAQRQFGGTLGISQQQIDLRAQELQDQARLEGRSLDLQEARDLASQQLTREGMAQEQGQFESTLGQRQSEFARTMGLNEREFEAQQAQFSQQFGEQVAGRLQQNEQFRTALESENARYGLDVGLRQKALELQEQGMNMEDAFNRAALDQERELTQSAQDLQRLGLEQEDAYRYAALLQDKTFQEEAQRLQALEMEWDEAFRRAELTFRSSQADRDEAFRKAEADREQERFKEMMEIWRQGQPGGTDEPIVPPPIRDDPGLWGRR